MIPWQLHMTSHTTSHSPGGCRALNLRRVLGAGSEGDGDVNRRQSLGPTTAEGFSEGETRRIPQNVHTLEYAYSSCDFWGMLVDSKSKTIMLLTV